MAAVATRKERSACVVVLGDIGRSPRMCNHALSLADHDFAVRLIGYPGAGPYIEACEKVRASGYQGFDIS